RRAPRRCSSALRERVGEVPAFREESVDGGDGSGEAIFAGAGDLDETASGTAQLLAEAGGHPGAQVLAVPEAVVLERHAPVVGEQPQIVVEWRGDRVDIEVGGAQVAFVPDRGGEGVGVAEQDR